MISVNKPRVRIIRGNEKNLRIGLIKALMMPKIRATMRMFFISDEI